MKKVAELSKKLQVYFSTIWSLSSTRDTFFFQKAAFGQLVLTGELSESVTRHLMGSVFALYHFRITLTVYISFLGPHMLTAFTSV